MEFYQRQNVVRIARELIGKVLMTSCEGKLTGGLIVETEAYSWKERGCHAFDGKKTGRNAVMFEEGGHAYVYFCYGMHYLFNVVTNQESRAEAVLIRAIEPLEGIETMKARRGNVRPSQLTSGPAKLAQALGIDKSMNGALLQDRIWIEDRGIKVPARDIVACPRVGIDYAGSDAQLPWRFYLKTSPWVSKP